MSSPALLSWNRKAYSQSFKLLKRPQMNPQTLIRDSSASVAKLKSSSLKNSPPRRIDKSILRDKYEDIIDEIIKQYAQEKGINIETSKIIKKNSYKNYRVLLEIESQQKSEKKIQETQKAQLMISRKRTEFPLISNSRHLDLPLSPKKEHLRALKLKLFTNEIGSSEPQGNSFQKKYVGKYGRASTEQ